jgi:hypothetical protein
MTAVGNCFKATRVKAGAAGAGAGAGAVAGCGVDFVASVGALGGFDVVVFLAADPTFPAGFAGVAEEEADFPVALGLGGGAELDVLVAVEDLAAGALVEGAVGIRELCWEARLIDDQRAK